MPDFKKLIARLKRHYGEPKLPPAQGPFELVMWENACYLLSDERRAAVFEGLRAQVGLDPGAILNANRDTLLALARMGVVDHLKSSFFELWPDRGPATSSAPQAQSSVRSSAIRCIVVGCGAESRRRNRPRREFPCDHAVVVAPAVANATAASPAERKLGGSSDVRPAAAISARSRASTLTAFASESIDAGTAVAA
jgi:hypothetical protein